MADDFDAGICNGSWWRAARINGTAGFDASGMGTSMTSCSSVNTDSSVTDMLMPMPMPGFGLSPAPPVDWNQSLLRSNTERDDQTSFHHLLQETPNYFRQDSSNLLVSTEEADQQQQFLLGQQRRSGFPVILQQGLGLFEPEAKPQRSIYEPTSSSLIMGNNNYQANDSLAKFTQLLQTSPPKNQSSSSSSTSNQLQFSNDAPFWNPSAVQFVAQSFEQKPNCSSVTTNKSNNTYSGTKKSSSSSEASLKKPRIETPSPLPTFKVRKEKLGDRITALQQLVSPFGKTDTASVLHEAIEYIKFLHEQVNVLSTPYLKNGHPMQHQQNPDMSKDAGEVTKHDLRSWGLCLVPTESIYPVASETMTDFWTPTFGGTYR